MNNMQLIQFHKAIKVKVIIPLACLFLVVACNGQQVDGTPQIALQSVTTQTLIQTDFYKHKQQFSGSIRAENTTGVGFELAGKIKRLLVDSGDHVVKGQALAELDTSLLIAKQDELAASLAQNNADLQLAQNTLNRSLELKASGYISEQTLDEAQGQLNSLIAGKKRLQASLQSIHLQLEKSTLLAPFAGSISTRHHNLGEVVQLGSPLFTLIESNSPHAYIGIPVKIARHFDRGQNVTVRVGDHAYPSRVSGVSGQLNAVTRTQELRIALPKSAPVINGELAYLDFFQQIDKTGYWVPISALTEGIRGLWNIYTVTPLKAGNLQADSAEFIIERRDVEIIYTDKDRAFIQGAINNSEMYIGQGLHKLVVGQHVIINQPSKAG